MLSALYFFGGLKSVCAVMLAVLIHELGHVAAIKVFGGKIRSVRFDASGLCMSYCGLDNDGKELVSLIMGPVFGLLLSYAASYCGKITDSRFLFEASGVSLIFSIFNLLPALPLDGGRALYCVIPSRTKAEKVLEVSGMLTGLCLVLDRKSVV